MFKGMFDRLYDLSSNDDLKMLLNFIRNRPFVKNTPANTRMPLDVYGALVYVGDAAKNFGELEVARMAIKMSGERLNYKV